MKEISEKILDIVEEQQEKQKISTRELAKKADCTVRAINYWKCGKRNISLKTAEKLLKALGCEIRIEIPITTSPGKGGV